MSPIPRCRSSFSGTWTGRCRLRPPQSAHDAGGEGLSKRTGALSIGSLRDSGIEALAVAALAVLTGSSHDVHPITSLAELQRGLRSLTYFPRAGAVRPGRTEGAVAAHTAQARLTNPCATGWRRMTSPASRRSRSGSLCAAISRRSSMSADWWRVVEGEIQPIVEDRHCWTPQARACRRSRGTRRPGRSGRAVWRRRPAARDGRCSIRCGWL